MTGRIVGYAVLAAALLIGGCTGPDDEPTVSERLEGMRDAPPVAPPDDQNRDRDPQAVTAALWALDPCELIAPGSGTPGKVERHSPHHCSLWLGSAEIDVEIGPRLVASQRFGLEPSVIAGAKVYVRPGGPRLGGCTAWLPVDFTRTIQVLDEFAECHRVRSLVRRMVQRIDDPRHRHPVPGVRGADTCTLLRRGLGSRMRGRKVVFGGSRYVGGGIDRCVAIGAARDLDTMFPLSGYARLELETASDQALTLEEGVSDTPTPTDYAASGWPDDFGTVRGRRVFGARKGVDGCAMRWAESTTVLQLVTPSCRRTRRAVTRTTAVLDSPPRERATAQEPVLYGPDDSDHARRGDCAEYMPLNVGLTYEPSARLPSGPRCHPYVEPELPHDPAEIVVAAEADPNVTCAISADAVRAAFGDRLRPATLERAAPKGWPPHPDLREITDPPLRVRPCVFVDPRRRVQVQVYVSSDPMAIAPRTADQLEESDSAMRTELASLEPAFMVGLGDDPRDPGYVAVFAGGRLEWADGTGRLHLLEDARDNVERVADAIVDGHLEAS